MPKARASAPKTRVNAARNIRRQRTIWQRRSFVVIRRKLLIKCKLAEASRYAIFARIDDARTVTGRGVRGRVRVLCEGQSGVAPILCRWGQSPHSGEQF